MASFDQKLRTLRLMEILLERTDDEHMLNASELCTILDQEYGISTDRRTIYTEMEVLDKFGLDIQQKKGKNPGYYIGARDFELPELKLLVDAVQSSKFITEKKSRELIQKLCCKTDAEMLSKYIFIVNRPKTENETVYYNVDYIHSAIFENKAITFQYAEWTVNKKLKLKKTELTMLSAHGLLHGMTKIIIWLLMMQLPVSSSIIVSIRCSTRRSWMKSEREKSLLRTLIWLPLRRRLLVCMAV